MQVDFRCDFPDRVSGRELHQTGAFQRVEQCPGFLALTNFPAPKTFKQDHRLKHRKGVEEVAVAVVIVIEDEIRKRMKSKIKIKMKITLVGVV